MFRPIHSFPHPRIQLLCLVLLLTTGSLTAQSDGPESSFSDAVQVEIVNIEVFATDKKGQPVTDLSREDFQVFEDGKRVELTNFAAYTPEPSAPEAVPVIEPAPVPARAETPPDPLFLVVFVDNQNLRAHTRKLLLTDLRGFLAERLRDDDQVMIVSAEPRLRLRQSFTSDRTVLAAALEQIEKDRPSGIDEDHEISRLLNEMTHAYMDDMAIAQTRDRLAGDQAVLAERNLARARMSFAVLEEFVGALAELPGRKAVMHLSDGITAGSELVDLRRVVAQANSNRVTFYSLNGGGSKQFSPRSAASPSVIQDLGWSNEAATAREDQRFASVARLAEDTGGQIFKGGKHLEKNLATLRDSMDAYYSLAFKPKKSGRDRDRAIEIKVERPGVELRYPQSYRLKTSEERLREYLFAALLMEVVENPLGIDIEMSASQGKGKKEDRYEVSMLVKIPLDNVVLLPGDQVHQGKLRIMYAVADAGGRASDVQVGELPLTIPVQRLDAAKGQLAGFSTRLEVSETTSRVAVAVYDEVALTTATAAVDFALGE